MCGGNSSKSIMQVPYQVIPKAAIPSGVGIQKEMCCALLLMVFFFFNQRVISASNDAPKTISRDRMIAGRSHLSIDRGSEIKIRGTVQRRAGNLWLLRAIHCSSSRGALPTPHSSSLPSSLNRQRGTLIVLSLVRLGRRAATFLMAAKPSGKLITCAEKYFPMSYRELSWAAKSKSQLSL